MQSVRKLLLGTVLIAVVLAGTSNAALADPVSGTHKEVLTVTCSGQTFEVVAGRGAAAQVVESHEVLIPAEFVEVSSWVDPQTGQTVTQTDAFSVGKGERMGRQADQISCTYKAIFEDPDVGSVTVNGTIVGFFAPRG
jgi:hypothetical protein